VTPATNIAVVARESSTFLPEIVRADRSFRSSPLYYHFAFGMDKNGDR